ncbi:MAG: hypothetical protein ACM33T_16290, partial [Solirubrobacterales bacterium]
RAPAVAGAAAAAGGRARPVGLWGARTGAAAPVGAAPRLGERVCSVVSRGGRPDLAGAALARVKAPTLLIVGGADPLVLDLNRQALAELPAGCRLEVVPGASHLFEEDGTLDMAAAHAAAWFVQHMPEMEERGG